MYYIVKLDNELIVIVKGTSYCDMKSAIGPYWDFEEALHILNKWL